MLSHGVYREAPTTPCPRGCTSPGEHLYDCQDTTDKPCRGCLPEPVYPPLKVCRGCARGFRRRIAELPAAAAELHRGLAPAAGVGGAAATSSGSPDFAGKRAQLEHLGQIAHDLTWLVTEVAQRRQLGGLVLDLTRPLQTVQRAATWLSVHVDWMLTQDDIPAWADTIHDVYRRATTLADRGPRTRFPLGRACPEPGCGAVLWSTMHDVGDPRPNLVWCEGRERHEWRPEQWLRLGHRLGFGFGRTA